MQGKEGARYREALNELVYEVERNELEERRSSIEAMLLQKYIDTRNAGEAHTCGLLAQMVIADQKQHDPAIEKLLSAQTAGAIFRELGFTKRHTNGGAIPVITEARLRVACKRYGIDHPDDSAAA